MGGTAAQAHYVGDAPSADISKSGSRTLGGSWIKQVDEELRPPAKLSPLVLDLFAGCGGLALGFEAAGFKTIGYELRSVFAETYEKNLQGKCNVTRIGESTSFPDAPVLIAGPPCQPFSNGGKREADRDERDGFPAVIAAVDEKRPRLALIENVPGILAGPRLSYFEQTVTELMALGYVVDYETLNAADFGVPQNRRRVFVVAHRGGFEFPGSIDAEAIPSGKALGRMASSVAAGARFLTPSMDDYVARYEEASKCRTPRDLDLARPARTLTCRNLAGATGDMMRIKLKDGRRRRLSVREAARLQSFPDWFRFKGRHDGSKFRQIGNAVPPLLALALAERVRAYLEQDDDRDDSPNGRTAAATLH